MISAIILAAGISSRMGSPKQLLKIGDRTLIRIVTENVLESCVEDVVVVTGHLDHMVRDAINDLPVKFAYNPSYAQGQASSLSVGVEAISDRSCAFLVFMCDQPFIIPEQINLVIHEYKTNDCLALRPVYQGLPGHPVIFHVSLKRELSLLQGDEGARQLLKKLGNQVRYLPVQDEAFVLDLDTPEVYKKFTGD